MSDAEMPGDDYIVKGVEERLAARAAWVVAVNKVLRKPMGWMTPSGLFVSRHLVAGVGLAALLVGGGVWVHWLVNTPEYQENYGLGSAEAHGRVNQVRPPAR